MIGVQGRDWFVKTFALTSSDVALTIAKAVRSFVIQNRSDADVQIRRETADTDYWTMKAGSSLSVDAYLGGESSTNTTVGYARLSSGTGTLEVLCIY